MKTLNYYELYLVAGFPLSEGRSLTNNIDQIMATAKAELERLTVLDDNTKKRVMHKGSECVYKFNPKALMEQDHEILAKSNPPACFLLYYIFYRSHNQNSIFDRLPQAYKDTITAVHECLEKIVHPDHHPTATPESIVENAKQIAKTMKAHQWSEKVGTKISPWNSAKEFSKIRAEAKREVYNSPDGQRHRITSYTRANEEHFTERLPHKMDWFNANLKVTLNTIAQHFNAAKPAGMPDIKVTADDIQKVKEGIMARPDTLNNSDEEKDRLPYIDTAATNPKVGHLIQRIIDKDKGTVNAGIKNKYTPDKVIKSDLEQMQINYNHYCNTQYPNYMGENTEPSEIDRNIQDLIDSRKLYIEMLEAYATDFATLKPTAATYSKNDLDAHIRDCKLKLYALEAMCSRDDRIAMAAAKRGVYVLPGALIAAGGASYTAFAQDESALQAMEALIDMGRGSFDKLWEGLAAGNPVLWAVMIGCCLGAVGLIFGLAKGAEMASHINNRHKALEYFEQEIGKIANEFQAKEVVAFEAGNSSRHV
ncbi:MAG: hypothetical protein JSS50_01580 [Proteobacteria bacterium]|nr:hypothetical protein [Pseudomonadota bacterium]